MSLKIDVRVDADLPAIPEQVRTLAEAGAAGVFTYEGPRDPVLPLAAATTGGPDVDLYTNLAIALPRSPMHLAYLAWDLQRASGGRFLLGLGTQVRAHVERRYGTTWEAPVAQLREWVEAIRAIHTSWSGGGPLAFEGRWTRHTLMPPIFDPGPLPSGPPPLLVGAVGPQMTAMATAVADGVLVHPFTTERALAEHTYPRVRDGLAAAGRARSDFTLIGQGIVAVATDEAELETALSAVRSLIGFYASTPAYRVVLEVHGWGELQSELRSLVSAGRWADLPAAVPDEVLRTVAVVGTPAEAGRELARRYAECDRVALSVPYAMSTETLAALLDATG